MLFQTSKFCNDTELNYNVIRVCHLFFWLLTKKTSKENKYPFRGGRALRLSVRLGYDSDANGSTIMQEVYAAMTKLILVYDSIFLSNPVTVQ